MEVKSWAGLQLRHLLALEAVGSELSFGRAAARLGYTSSAVSQQIATLEDIVGTVLVERKRGPHPVALTPAGHVLLEHVRTITARLAAARADVAAVTTEQPVSLRVGTYQSVGARILPVAIQRFRAAWPTAIVTLHELNTDDQLLRLVETGDLDVTFAVLPLGGGPFEWVEVIRDPYVLLVREDSPLARRSSPPTAKEIASLDVVGFRECRSVHEAESRIRSAGVDLRIVFRSNDNGTLQGLVSAGIGCAFVPRLAYEKKDDGVVALDLGDLVPSRVLALAWHRDRSETNATCAFVKTVLSVSSTLDIDM